MSESAEAAPGQTTPTFCATPDCGLRATRVLPDADGVRWRPYCNDCAPNEPKAIARAADSEFIEPPLLPGVAPPPNPYRDLSVTTREGAKHYAWKMGYAAGVAAGRSLPSTGTGWDRGYAAGRAAERDQAWRWTIHVCPKGHKSLEPPLNGVCWKCWPGGRGPAEEHTAIRVAEVRR